MMKRREIFERILLVLTGIIAKISCIISVLILIFVICHEVSGETYEISGKVGSSLKKHQKFMIFYGQSKGDACNSCVNELIFYTRPDASGRFHFEIESSGTGNWVQIFVISGDLEEYYSPYAPDMFYQGNENGKQKGIRVLLGKQKKINVGTLTKIIEYSIVHVELRRVVNQFPTENELWVKLVNRKSNLDFISSIPKKGLLPNSNSIVFVLPKDIWEIGFSKRRSPWKAIGKIKVNLTSKDSKHWITF